MSRVFNGSAGFLRNLTDDLGITSYPCTVAYWVKFTTLTTSHCLNYDNDSVTNKYLDARTQAAGTVSSVANQSAVSSATSPSTHATGVWLPFVHVFDTNLVRVDGPALTDTASSTTAQTWSTNNAPRVNWGKQHGGTPINGKMGYMTVWDTVLSEANIDSYLNGDNPIGIDAANQTRLWECKDSNLTDLRNSVVLTASAVTNDDLDNPPIATAATPDIIGDIDVGILVQATFNPSASLPASGRAAKKNKQAYLIY